jgi:hypothetical protein
MQPRVRVLSDQRYPDFDTEVLKEVADITNLAGNFPHVHAPPIESMLSLLDETWSREDLTPTQIHNLQIEQMYTFIKRSYQKGRMDGLTLATMRVNDTIFGRK